MEADFWHRRWAKREIGFHQQDINPFLRSYWPQLGLADGAQVFVPLCGKSLDMRWLLQQGYSVLGIELSETAVQEFFAEWGVTPQVEAKSPFVSYRAEGIELLVGDFFALTAEHLAEVDAVYDRAALVALPTPMREDYVRALAHLLPSGVPTLLVTFSYRSGEMDGPPFAVDAKEVQRLFVDHCHLVHLATKETELRGQWVNEHVFRMTYS